MINIQPTLVGRLVRIRPLIQADLQDLANVSSDKKIWDQHPDPRRCQRDYFRQKFFIPALECKGALTFEKLQNGKLIGSSRYYNYRPQTKDIMIGYTFISRDCWGSTYNRQIKHLMMSHIYQFVDTILFTVGKNNFRSQKAVGKIGGRLLTQQQSKKKLIHSKASVFFQIKKQDFKGLV